MSTNSKHTETPWQNCLDGTISARIDRRDVVVAEVNGNLPDCAANAAFIVRAVNVHAELVELAKALVAVCALQGSRGQMSVAEADQLRAQALVVLAKLDTSTGGNEK